MSRLVRWQRSGHWQHIRQGAAGGGLCLQVCEPCQAVQYPPRDNCRQCLSDKLTWQPVCAEGVVMAWSRVHASTQAFFREHAPWHVANIRLDCGVVLYAFVSERCLQTGTRVYVHPVIDSNDEVVFVATTVAGVPATEYERITALTEG